MRTDIRRSQIALAVAAVIGGIVALPATSIAQNDRNERGPDRAGKYVAGDIHNHTTCSDGSISMQKLVKKSIDKQDTPWGLDWFVQAGHGGNGNRNCTLVEDPSLATPVYPYVEGKGPTTTWANSIGAAAVKGNVGGTNTTPLNTQASPNMWRWQSIQEFQYPVTEYLAALREKPVFLGLESVVAGHEHTSLSVVSGQVIPARLKNRNATSYTPAGNAVALAKWSYCFDRGDTDNSRGGGQGWDCSVPGSANASDPSWNATAAKLMPAGGTGAGERGHAKTVEAVKWMAANYEKDSYYIPTHLERAGPFNPNGNNGFNIEHLRNFNNAAPAVAFGFETQPGHGASDNRGEYSPDRNNIGGTRMDSVGGTTWGGTGVYGAYVGGVWDALLGEGRNYWFLASSDWHNRGSFGPDDRRSTQDFYPGEYQRMHVLAEGHYNHGQQLTPRTVVEAMRSGNIWTDSGQLVDRLAYVACVDPRGNDRVEDKLLAAVVTRAALDNEAVRIPRANCATMGEKLRVRKGDEVVVAIAVRDPQGTSYSPYTFANPSLAQVGIQQPLNKPVLDHVDLIQGLVTGYRTPGSADYAAAWPDNWVDNPNPALLPAAVRNDSAKVIKTWSEGSWSASRDRDAAGVKTMVLRLKNVQASQYLRLRGSNLPASVPYETDASGNPLADLYTNASNTSLLRIPCFGNPSFAVPATYTGAAIDGCPAHLPTVNGLKFVAYDVAAWSDLWFYSNPIYVEVAGGTRVAGVR